MKLTKTTSTAQMSSTNLRIELLLGINDCIFHNKSIFHATVRQSITFNKYQHDQHIDQ